jgi:hypothetical protein
MVVWTCGFFALAQLFLWPWSMNVASAADFLASEAARWSVLTYTQRYIDDENEQVVYHGTLFLQLSNVSLSGCDLKLTVRVQDKFTGTTIERHGLSVKKTELGPRTQTSTYKYVLRLGDLQGVSTTVIQGRPVQIRPHTGYTCNEDASCSITWLHVKFSEALIKETLETDGFTNFDEMVKQIDIPISSREAAQGSATQLKALVAACGSNTGR